MRLFALSIATTLITATAWAAPATPFTTGPIIEDYGPVAVLGDFTPLPDNASFKIAFDVTEAAKDGEISRRLESVARFMNLNGRAGVPEENMSLAVVVHSAASADLVAGEDNANAGLIAALVEKGVRIELCGQTAAHYGIAQADLLPGIVITPSAMTSHALLQQDGYTLNPF